MHDCENPFNHQKKFNQVPAVKRQTKQTKRVRWLEKTGKVAHSSMKWLL